jgi:transposase
VKKADATCQCGLATRLVGDGCERCNPQLAIQLLKEQIADMRLTDEEREALEQAIWRIEHHYQPGRAVLLRELLKRLG